MAQQTTPATGQGDAFGSGTESCAYEYGPQSLARLSLAFDGTVVSIGEPQPRSVLWMFPVVFQVNRWYRGGTGTQITVWMLRPARASYAQADSEYGVVFDVGSRLLVSGVARFGPVGSPNDPVAGTCGFTRWYTDADARVWEQVFR